MTFRNLGLAAGLMLAATPGLAADDYRMLEAGERRSALFAGAGLSVPLDRRAAKPAARLQFGATHSYRSVGAPERTYRAAIVELGLGQRGRPALAFAGQELPELRDRLGLSSTGTALAVVGGLAAIALIAVAAGGGDGDDDIIEAPPPRPVP